VRRLFVLLVGLALVAVLRRRRRAPHPAPEGDPRAEALRERLAEAKSAVGEREEFEAGETPVDKVDIDERRKRVQKRAQAAVEEMQSASGGELVDDEGA